MEIERKYLVKELPKDLSSFPHHEIEQAYLCRNPVIRIRKQDEDYYLTYKSGGLMVREEYNLPLNREAYMHLKEKVDGKIITKNRYLIPHIDGLMIELDIFSGFHKGLVIAEVEFVDEKQANAFVPPDWFSTDVTFDGRYHNSRLSDEGTRQID